MMVGGWVVSGKYQNKSEIFTFELNINLDLVKSLFKPALTLDRKNKFLYEFQDMAKYFSVGKESCIVPTKY